MVWIYLNSSFFWKKTATSTPACVGSALGGAHPLYILLRVVIPHRSQLHKLPDWTKLGLDRTTTIYSVLTLSISLFFGRRIDAFELWCWRRLFRVPWTCEEIKAVNPKGDHSWVFIGRTDAEAETPILWPPDVKNWLIWKDPDAGKDWRQEEKGTTEDEMVGWHHRLDRHGFE